MARCNHAIEGIRFGCRSQLNFSEAAFGAGALVQIDDDGDVVRRAIPFANFSIDIC